ncbi:MAG: hypothetical protein ACON4Z_17215, partial [Planctomycetota bacterium]
CWAIVLSAKGGQPDCPSVAHAKLTNFCSASAQRTVAGAAADDLRCFFNTYAALRCDAPRLH